MTSRARTLTPLLTVVATLAFATSALASPDGDDDPTYNNAGSTFGTQYSAIGDFQGSNGFLLNTQPVTDQAPDGASITANLVSRQFIPTRGLTGPGLRLTRFDINGQPGGLSGDGTREITLDPGLTYTELLDIRVLGDGTFVVLIRARDDEAGDRLITLRFTANGTAVGTASSNGYPEACFSDNRGEGPRAYGYVSAARVNASGAISALWDCYFLESVNGPDFVDRGNPVAIARTGVVVAQYDTNSSETDSVEVAGLYGEDLELGPNGDPYALVATSTVPGRGDPPIRSVVDRVPLSGGDLTSPSGSLFEIPGEPVDLAVDIQGRSVVWTSPTGAVRGGSSTWSIFRLIADRSALDTSWSGDGRTDIADPRLSFPFSGGDFNDDERSYLTVRPGDKVLVTDGYRQQEPAPRELNDFRNGIIAGLTSGGELDTGFATAGFKVFEYTGDLVFDRIGEPTLQSDGKVLIPHTSEGDNDERSAAARITPPPTDDDAYVGVTRLVGGSPATGVSLPTTTAGGELRPSATPAICGRRAISLVRADVRGKRVRLTGLVGAALFGKTVTIQTDPKGSRASKFTRTTTVRASSMGSFTAFVPRPKAADFVSIRYRAVSGSAKSPVLKLPQRLTSRSVKSAAGTITVTGRVKKSVLGKRNRVKIRRLVCGRYRTVGTAKPDANGNYTVKFRATQIRGVAFYRAESMVLRKPGSKTYVIQYARAIAIRTTSQTG